MSIFKEEQQPFKPNPLRGARRLMFHPSHKQWMVFLVTLALFLGLYSQTSSHQPASPVMDPIKAFEQAINHSQLSDSQIQTIIEDALKKWPESEKVRLIASQHFIKNLNYSAALQSMSWRPEPFNEHKNYYGTLAFIHLQMKNHEQAISLYQTLSQIDPKNPKWWLGLGTCFDLNNQPEKAKTAWQKTRLLASPSASYYSIIKERLTHYGEMT